MAEPQRPNVEPESGETRAVSVHSAQPSPRRKRRIPWWVGGIIGLVLLFCVLVLVAAALLAPRLVRGTTGEMRGANGAVTGYYGAVKAHDWNRAQSYLSTALRSSTKPSDLQAEWTQREAAYGKVDDFEVTGTNVRVNTSTGTTAIVDGTLRYKSGQSETKVVNLVKEGGDWKLATLP